MVDLWQVSNHDQRRSDKTDPLRYFEHGDSPMTPTLDYLSVDG
jgi:hypothetical protein